MYVVTVAESNSVERFTFNNLPAAQSHIDQVVDCYQDDGIKVKYTKRMVKVLDIFQRETIAIIRLEVN